MHVESGIPNLQFRTVYDQPFLSQRWAHSHHCNRKYLRFELSIWSILDIDTGQLNQHLKLLVYVKTNTGIHTVSIPFPCYLPELQLCLCVITDLYQTSRPCRTLFGYCPPPALGSRKADMKTLSFFFPTPYPCHVRASSYQAQISWSAELPVPVPCTHFFLCPEHDNGWVRWRTLLIPTNTSK